MDFPDPDDIGFTDDAHTSENGPIVNAIQGAAGTQVRFHRMEISLAARLHIVSSDPALVQIDLAAPWAFHSTADHKVAPSNDQKIRDDSVTRRRLLYPYISLPSMTAKRWRNDVGYGHLVTGCMVSARQLSQDVSLDEVTRARAVASAAGRLYAR